MRSFRRTTNESPEQVADRWRKLGRVPEPLTERQICDWWADSYFPVNDRRDLPLVSCSMYALKLGVQGWSFPHCLGLPIVDRLRKERPLHPGWKWFPAWLVLAHDKSTPIRRAQELHRDRRERIKFAVEHKLLELVEVDEP